MTSWYTDKTNLAWACFNLTPVQSLDSSIMGERLSSFRGKEGNVEELGRQDGQKTREVPNHIKRRYGW